MIIHYWCRSYYGHVVGTGSRGMSDHGWIRVVTYPREGRADQVLRFDTRQAAIDWLKHNVNHDTIIADTEDEFRASTKPTVYIEDETYPGPHFIFPTPEPDAG